MSDDSVSNVSNVSNCSDTDKLEDNSDAPYLTIVPFSLPAGYTFDAVVDGQVVRAVVPEGGCKEGDVIEIPVNQVRSESQDESKTEKDKSWSHGLFSCCEIACSCLFWMSLLFPCIVLGQLMQRIKLNIWGVSGRADNSFKVTCTLVFIFVMIVLFFIPSILMYFYIRGEMQNDIFLYSAVGVMAYYMIISWYWNARLRQEYQRKLQLEPVCGVHDNACIALWCQCCSLIQVGRQYPFVTSKPHQLYHCCTPTGLGKEVPDDF